MNSLKIFFFGFMLHNAEYMQNGFGGILHGVQNRILNFIRVQNRFWNFCSVLVHFVKILRFLCKNFCADRQIRTPAFNRRKNQLRAICISQFCDIKIKSSKTRAECGGLCRIEITYSARKQNRSHR